MPVVDEIREAAAWVAGRAGRVSIEEERLDAYAAGLDGIAAQIDAGPGGDDHPAEGATERRAAYALTLDAINFGSGWFPVLRRPDGLSGYRTIERAVDERFDRHGPWTARELAGITAAEVAETLGQDPDLELMRLFAESLADLGARLLADHDGRFEGPVERAAGSAVELVEELAAWKCFHDFSAYQGRRIPFLKRAQIAAADLHRAGAASFEDLDRLTLFADNLVPHVLRLDGILGFDEPMTARIESGELLDPGGAEEIEMRACAVHAVELLASRSQRLSPAVIDRILWERGSGPDYKAVPRPRCRTTAY